MAITVHLPSALRPECGGQSKLMLEAATVREALARLELEYPRVYRSVCDETGEVRMHIHLFANSQLVRSEEELERRLAGGDELYIMTAVSGG